MIVINLTYVAHALGFLVVWSVLYALSLAVRFGENISKRSEAVTIAVTFGLTGLGYLLFFTNVFKFVTS